MFSEETDWCYRFRQAGWSVWFFPGAEVVHVGGASHGGRLFAENVRGHLRFLAKHRGTREAERARRLLLAGVRLRLGAAVACLLIPGALISRALRLRGFAPALAWTLAALLFAFAITFAVHGSLWLALALFATVGVVALPFQGQTPGHGQGSDPLKVGVVAVGVVFGIALWYVAILDGDAFFHLARVRKLEVFGSLSLQNVGEFKDGSLHPGYAFPLWHGFLAFVGRLADVDPIAVGR